MYGCMHMYIHMLLDLASTHTTARHTFHYHISGTGIGNYYGMEIVLHFYMKLPLRRFIEIV